MIEHRYRRSSSDNSSTQLNKARRSSNLSREIVLEPTTATTNPLDTSEEDEKDSETDSNSDSEGESLQMRNGRQEDRPGVRRLSERRPEPPTLQLRRTSATSVPGTSPRVVSGFS